MSGIRGEEDEQPASRSAMKEGISGNSTETNPFLGRSYRVILWQWQSIS